MDPSNSIDTSWELNVRLPLAAALQGLVANGHRTVVVTSALPGEGRSTVTSEAGVAVASAGRDGVLLVDADPLRPSLHLQFGLTASRGLGELLDEVYRADPTEESLQFGVGDWLEILCARGATGELTVRGEGRTYAIRIVQGSIASLACRDDEPETRLGDLLIERGRITPGQCQDALRVQEETGRPLGEVLVTLGWVPAEDLGSALRGQAGCRLARLIALGRPECHFHELAEPFLPASGGRPPDSPGPGGVDELVMEGFGVFLKQPFLSSQVPSYLVDTRVKNLKILTAGRRTYDPGEPLDRAAFHLLLRRLARTFDLVLIDAPPLSRPGTPALLADLADGVLLVVKAGWAGVDGARLAVADLKRAGSDVLGVVLNQADVPAQVLLVKD